MNNSTIFMKRNSCLKITRRTTRIDSIVDIIF